MEELKKALNLYAATVADEIEETEETEDVITGWSDEYTYTAYRDEDENICVDSFDGVLTSQEIANANDFNTMRYNAVSGTFK